MRSIRYAIASSVLLIVAVLTSPANAAGAQSDANRDWIFTAPPRGTEAAEQAVYEPIAQMLTQVTGHKVVYQHPRNWLNYSKQMVDGNYDVVFDGPQFNGWRMDHLGFQPLVSLPGKLVFVTITRNDSGITDVKQLVGKTVCAHAPPQLGTLYFLDQFENPARQPRLIEVNGWGPTYEALMANKCAATILPLGVYGKVEPPEKRSTRILLQNPPTPSDTFSVGPRIPAPQQAKIQAALLSAEGAQATLKLRETWASKDSALVAAKREDYQGIGDLLRNALYFNQVGGSK
jgi:ABC-type phosphate/phosphonate transport system substrate-binding protein